MTQWITELVGQLGYWAIALLMMLENIFPPIPSEAIMPLAEYSAADGELNIIFVILSGTVGTTAGAFFWWWVAKLEGIATQATRPTARSKRVHQASCNSAAAHRGRAGSKCHLAGRSSM